MKKYIGILKKTRLFSGVSEEEIFSMLSCLSAQLREYGKGEYVFQRGEHVSRLAVLLSGELHVRRDDYWGNRTIISHIGKGEMFGEAYIAPESPAIMNDVVATEESVVIFFDVRRIITTCSTACPHHTAVVGNLLFAVCEKNRRIVQKVGHLSERSTREKLMSYLSLEATRQGSGSIVIPFDRQELADYLSVDRSAMSKELCRMRDEGLLRFRKNKFELL